MDRATQTTEYFRVFWNLYAHPSQSRLRLALVVVFRFRGFSCTASLPEIPLRVRQFAVWVLCIPASALIALHTTARPSAWQCFAVAFFVGFGMHTASGVWFEDSASPAATSLSCASLCMFRWHLGKLTLRMCAPGFVSLSGNPFAGWRITGRGTSYSAIHTIRIRRHMRTSFVVPN